MNKWPKPSPKTDMICRISGWILLAVFIVGGVTYVALLDKELDRRSQLPTTSPVSSVK